MTGDLIKWGNLDTDTHTQEEYHVKMKAEIRVMQQKPRNERLPATPRSYKRGMTRFFFTTFQRNQLHQHFDLRLSSLQNRDNEFLLFEPPNLWLTLLWQP